MSRIWNCAMKGEIGFVSGTVFEVFECNTPVDL